MVKGAAAVGTSTPHNLSRQHPKILVSSFVGWWEDEEIAQLHHGAELLLAFWVVCAVFMP